MSSGLILPRGRGRIPPPNLPDLKADSHARHGARLALLPNVTATHYDCRTLGIVPPVRNQKSCGSCWDFSGSGICTSALIQAGYGKPDGSFGLSEQMVMDCGRNGGCGGDDNTTVCQMCKTSGIAADADYGPYQGYGGRCKTGTKLYQIVDWGFVDGSGNGVTDTQLIKNAMVKYGPIGCAIAADGAFENHSAGSVFTGSGSRNIDHDVILVGWQDDATLSAGGAWILRNSWGAQWCEDGYQRIAYGANQVGTEAIWATAMPLGPLPQPPA